MFVFFCRPACHSLYQKGTCSSVHYVISKTLHTAYSCTLFQRNCSDWVTQHKLYILHIIIQFMRKTWANVSSGPSSVAFHVSKSAPSLMTSNGTINSICWYRYGVLSHSNNNNNNNAIIWGNAGRLSLHLLCFKECCSIIRSLWPDTYGHLLTHPVAAKLAVSAQKFVRSDQEQSGVCLTFCHDKPWNPKEIHCGCTTQIV